MLTVAEALDAVMRESRVLPPAVCLLEDVLECVLAEDVEADADSPPFDKALVDGYAVRTRRSGRVRNIGSPWAKRSSRVARLRVLSAMARQPSS